MAPRPQPPLTRRVGFALWPHWFPIRRFDAAPAYTSRRRELTLREMVGIRQRGDGISSSGIGAKDFCSSLIEERILLFLIRERAEAQSNAWQAPGQARPAPEDFTA